MAKIILSDKEADLVSELAKKTEQSEAKIVRDALRNYIFGKQWKEIQEFGKTMSKRLGIKSEEDVTRVFD